MLRLSPAPEQGSSWTAFGAGRGSRTSTWDPWKVATTVAPSSRAKPSGPGTPAFPNPVGPQGYICLQLLELWVYSHPLARALKAAANQRAVLPTSACTSQQMQAMLDLAYQFEAISTAALQTFHTFCWQRP